MIILGPEKIIQKILQLSLTGPLDADLTEVQWHVLDINSLDIQDFLDFKLKFNGDDC